MFQAQIPIGNLPVQLVLVGSKGSGRVVFVRVAPFKVIFDTTEDGKFIRAAFYDDVFHIFDNGGGYEEVFSYNTIYDYKEIPVMLDWLQKQNLMLPTNVAFA